MSQFCHASVTVDCPDLPRSDRGCHSFVKTSLKRASALPPRYRVPIKRVDIPPPSESEDAAMTTETPRPLDERLRDAAKRAKELSAKAKRQRKREEDAAFLHDAAERAAKAAEKKARAKATRMILRARMIRADAGNPVDSDQLTRSERKAVDRAAYAAHREAYASRREELRRKMQKARVAAKAESLLPAERDDYLAAQERKQARRSEKASTAPAELSPRAQERAARRAANKAAHAAKQAETEAARNAVETAALIALVEARQGGDE